MLKGAEKSLEQGRIGWLFISTHRDLEDAREMDLHEVCRDLIEAHGYRIYIEHTPEESYSVDGLIVAHHPGEACPPEIKIGCSLRHTYPSSFYQEIPYLSVLKTGSGPICSGGL